MEVKLTNKEQQCTRKPPQNPEQKQRYLNNQRSPMYTLAQENVGDVTKKNFIQLLTTLRKPQTCYVTREAPQAEDKKEKEGPKKILGGFRPPENLHWANLNSPATKILYTSAVAQS